MIRKPRAARGQAMVEFALVLPLMLAIIFVVIVISLVYAIKIAEQKATYNGAVYIARLSADPNTPHPQPFETIDKLSVGVLTDPNYWSTDTTNPVRSHAQEVSTDVRNAMLTVLPDWAANFVDDQGALCPGATNNPEVKTGPDLNSSGFYAVQSIEVRYCYRLKAIPGWDVLAAIWGGKANPGLIEERAIGARLPSEF